MGKKMHTKNDVSPERTNELGLVDLLALNTKYGDTSYHAVHKRYFNGGKLACPACGSTKTRCSKVLNRKFKDILWESKDSFEVVGLIFYQRYLRCDGCNDSVFPEEIDFGQKGCRYTNRLADKLADGTFLFSYQKVCNFYGVPASTASVGSIMRRRIQYRESLLDPIKTPKTLCIVEIGFYGDRIPVILAIWNNEVYCLNVLENSDEATYITFFRSLDMDSVETVCIEPEESLKSAVSACFPMASVVITQECIHRYARNAMIDIIQSDGKRFPVKHKNYELTRYKKLISDPETKRQITKGMKIRPRLKKAYDHYQRLLELSEAHLMYEDLTAWANGLPEDLNEFADVIDIIEIYEDGIREYLSSEKKLPKGYATSVQAICDAFDNMPRCIFDVLRGRSIFALSFDTVEENDEKKRLGIRYDRMTTKMNEISENIREEREYGLER